MAGPDSGVALSLGMLTKGFFLASAVAGCALLRSSALQTPPASLRANKAVVMKSQRTLTLLRDDHVLKTYRIALGSHPVGPKTQQGDGKTPEGHYVLDRRNPKSRFHLSMHVSYPDSADVARARKLGVAPGGDIFVHGLPGG